MLVSRYLCYVVGLAHLLDFSRIDYELKSAIVPFSEDCFVRQCYCVAIAVATWHDG